MAKKTYYGGQAVMEGVMMRGAKTMVVAVRRPNGEIVTEPQMLPSLYTGWARKTPILRGIIVLIESVVLGIQTLMFSANIALEEETTEGGKSEEVSGSMLWIIVAIGMVLAVAIFFLAPLFITRLFINQSSPWFNVVEGVIRLAFFILYLAGVGFMPSIRRVFAYHGAEHKTVNAYENDAPLEVESVKKFIPVIAAFAYEVTYFAGRHSHNPFVRAILTPGLWLQSLTTRKPDDSMLEVGIAALKKVLEIEHDEQPSAAAAGLQTPG